MTGLSTQNRSVINGGTFRRNNIIFPHHLEHEGNPLTICIAAIATENNEEYIVFATDHMVSVGLGQFEHSVNKYREINKRTVAMLSGEGYLFNGLLNGVTPSLQYSEIKDAVFHNFKVIRPAQIQDEILDIYGFDWNDVRDFLKQQIPNQFIQNMLEEISEYDLKTTIMLIGFKDDDNAEITAITHSYCIDQRDMNFNSIGNGGDQATNTLLFSQHDKKDSLLKTIYEVFKAKRNAEVKPGVGKKTELMVLRKDKGFIRITDDQIKILDRIYQGELRYWSRSKNLKSISLKWGE